MGPRASVGRSENITPDPVTVQPVNSRYTYITITVQRVVFYLMQVIRG
jgi:hypothetical protein